jgi:hypothetical protein
MKKAISSKSEKKTKSRKKQNSEVATEAVKILRTVKDQEAFYFYEAVGRPTGEIAINLTDFLDKVKSAKSESLAFHLQRRDFQNWIEKILGDSELAGKLGRISSSNGDDIRLSIYRTVENRINELRESLVQIHVDDSPAILVTPF